MSARWIRTRPGGRETLAATLAATAVALGAGVLTFYLTRTLLAREPLSPPEAPVRSLTLGAPGPKGP